MLTFQYKALSVLDGSNKTGTVKAVDIVSARQILSSKKLYTVSLQEVVPNNFYKRILSVFTVFKQTLSTSTLVLIIRQLATLVSSGIQLEQAFSLMIEHADNKSSYKFMLIIQQQLTEGMSFSYSLKNSGYNVPYSFIAAVEYAEETGNMGKVLERLSDDIEVQAATQNSLKSALAYPILMVCVASAIVILLMVYVVPQVAQVFIDSQQQLPTLTIAVMYTSDFIRDHGLVMMVLFVLFILFVGILLQQEKYKLQLHKRVLSLPMVGNWILISQLARWSRSLGSLLSSGVPVIQSMTISGHAVSNLFIGNALANSLSSLKEGKSLHVSLGNQKLFPGFLLHMISTGEASGDLDKLLLKTADYYEHKVKTAVDTMLKLFEPLLILGMGGLVLLIVMAILVPIFELNQLVG